MHNFRLTRSKKSPLKERLADKTSMFTIQVKHLVFGLAAALLFGIVVISNVTINSKTSAAALPELSSPTIQLCGERESSDIEEYTGPTLPSPGYSTLIPNEGSGFFRYWQGSSGDPRMYTMTGSTTSQASFSVYDADTASLISSFNINIPSNQQGPTAISQFAVDPSGNIDIAVYATSGPDVSEWTWTTGNSTATEGWTASTTGLSTGGIYDYHDSNNVARVGVVVDSSTYPHTEAYSNTFNASTGAAMGNNIVIGSNVNVSTQHNNDIVSAGPQIDTSGGGYVYVYNSTGTTQTLQMGTNLGPNQAGPWHFYILNSADEESNGDIVVSDSGNGIMFFDPTGVYLGTVALNVNNGDSLPAGGNIQVDNGNIYIQYGTGTPFSNPHDLDYVTQSNATTLLAAPQGAPFHMGIGAGLYTNVLNNYFMPGTTPQAYLEFYPWWASQASNYTVSYSIRNIQQIENNQSVTPTSFALSSQLSSGATSPANISLTIPTQPDFYQINAQLVKNGQVVGADCLDYSVGATGDSLNFNSVNANNGDAQVVALAYEFGQKLVRGSYGIDNCLSGVSTVTSSTQLSCPSSMVTDIQNATTLASQDGIQYEIQVATGTSLDASIVSSGQWGRLVQSFVSQFSDVHDWEAWNEMNNTYSSNASTCVTNIIEPFYNAVKAANPNATVVGGSVLNISTSFWQGIGQAGGFQYMNAIGDHPYTGNNRSFEEQGQVAVLQSLQGVLSSAGYPNMPIWDTETGYWDSGPASYFSLGNKLTRTLLLEQSIGITNFNNYQNDNPGSQGGLVWSLIDSTGLNPGGLAAVNYKHMIGGRSFVKTITTGIPHTYAEEFGPSGTDTGSVVAVWADDYSVGAAPTLSGGGTLTLTGEYGGVTTPSSGSDVTLTGDVQYINVPAGQTLTINPAETFGTDYALASQGSTAIASSSFNCGSFSLSPSSVIDGVDNAQGIGDVCDGGMSVWAQSSTDASPSITITLGSARTIDRVFVSSQGIDSTETGLRSYAVQVNNGSGTFTTVATVSNQFFYRNNLVTFAPQTVSQIRITNMAINYSGYSDGLPPTFWTSGFNDLASIYEIEAYAPGTQNSAPTVPTVSVTAPTANTDVHDIATITASATDNSGSGLAKVVFLVDGSVADTATTSPYSYQWDTLSIPDGNHTIEAQAYDNDGDVGSSATIPVIVNNGDINGDNAVSILDLSVMAGNWKNTNATYQQGDLNGDKAVNILDLSILGNNWGWSDE